MLDRVKLLRELEKTAQSMFIDVSPVVALAHQLWDEIKDDPTHAVAVQQVAYRLQLPTWDGLLSHTHQVKPITQPYTILSVDGSQVYPDRHQGTNCYLLNIGTVAIDYARGIEGVQFKSLPYIFAGLEDEEFDEAVSIDLINCKRHDYELVAALQLCQEYQDRNPVLLFDGSYIFWHLEAKKPELKEQFFAKHLVVLEQLYRMRIPHAGFISMPRSKELIQVLKHHQETVHQGDVSELGQLTDAVIARFALNLGQATTIFQNHSPIAALYPDHLKPYFLYLDVGQEIVRVEFPAWIAHDAAQVEHILAVALDQSRKGYGYPVALAEAHEQAVVKGPDREFFYHCMHKQAVTYRRVITPSQKSAKKRTSAI